ncbi:MAG: DUF1294 domain-containing protein [Clostridia bacterium]|nr:DUF1294 domain-containing protein [Clostridia bacterium]
MKWLLLWIGVTSLIAFFLYGSDKARAKQNRYRIPEKVLLGIALLGGSLGAMAGMQIFRHKTKKLKFLLGIPLCLLLNALAIWYLSANLF